MIIYWIYNRDKLSAVCLTEESAIEECKEDGYYSIPYTLPVGIKITDLHMGLAPQPINTYNRNQ